MSSINTLQELLVDQLNDLHSAERQLVKALPHLAEAAANPELKQGFLDHLEETKGHIDRIEKAFSFLGEDKKEKTCKAMEGLIKEGKEAIDMDAPSSIRDAGLIAAAQRVEHYEISAYGTARTMASEIGQDDVADLLQETLDEESEADGHLTEIASTVNVEAKMVGEDRSAKGVGVDPLE